MATPFSTIYKSAIFRFADHKLLKLALEDREALLEKYLHSAQADFVKICRIDLTDRDDTLKQYNQDLDEECIEIFGLGIAYYWVSAQTLNIDLLVNNLSTKDASYYSPGNLLKEVSSLRNSLRKEFKNRIIEYSYSGGGIASLKA